MPSQVTEISPIQVEVAVEVPWDEVKKDIDDTVRRVGRTARVKGFRPGKVPFAVAKKLFGQKVRGDVAAGLVERGLLSAVREHELQIVAEPTVDGGQIEEGQPLNFKATFEVRPKVDKVILDGLDITVPTFEVKDEDVDAEVTRMQREHSDTRAPDPMRPAKAGDELTIDYEVDLDGEPKEEMAATGRKVELGSDSLLPEFEAGLVGAKPGDEKTIPIAFDGDDDRPELAGKTAQFKIRVTDLHERVMPELDDEFAKDVGDFETLLELRLDIRSKLEKVAQQRKDGEVREQTVDKLVELNPVPVPPSMIQQESQRMMMEFAELARMGVRPPALDDNFMEQIKTRAERKVQAAILLGALARQAELTISPEEVDAKFIELAESTGKHIAKVRAEYQGDRKGSLESELLEKKLMDYLFERTTITESDEPTPTGDEDKAEAKPKQKAEAKPKKKAPAKKAPAKKAAAKKAPTKKKATKKESE